MPGEYHYHQQPEKLKPDDSSGRYRGRSAFLDFGENFVEDLGRGDRQCDCDPEHDYWNRRVTVVKYPKNDASGIGNLSCNYVDP